MSTAEGSTTVRLFSWVPLASFVALLATMAVVSILPPDRHLAYSVVEWGEMIIGTLSAIVACVFVFAWPRFVSPAAQGMNRYKWLAICGLAVWFIFWVIALLARPWTD